MKITPELIEGYRRSREGMVPGIEDPRLRARLRALLRQSAEFLADLEAKEEEGGPPGNSRGKGGRAGGPGPNDRRHTQSKG